MNKYFNTLTHTRRTAMHFQRGLVYHAYELFVYVYDPSEYLAQDHELHIYTRLSYIGSVVLPSRQIAMGRLGVAADCGLYRALTPYTTV